MDFYEYILKTLSNFPYCALDSKYSKTFFSTLDGDLVLIDKFVYGTNASTKKVFEDKLEHMDMHDFGLHHITEDTIYEQSLYTMSSFGKDGICKVFLETGKYFAFMDDEFYYSYPSTINYKIPSTLEDWFNMSMVLENILSLEEFNIIQKIREVVPNGYDFEIYKDCWEEHKSSLTKDIKSIG